MKKNNLVIVMVLAALLLAFAQAGAEEAYTDERQKAMDALLAERPGAVVDYLLRERDDGRYEWELFFTQGDQLGVCEVAEDTYQVRRVALHDRPEGALTASEAIELLRQKKGEITVTSLDLDRDDGRLRYEGEAELDGKRYEFEMSVSGEIVEWERD